MLNIVSGPTPISDDRAVLGEGPLWDHRVQMLYWLDIKGEKLFTYSEEYGHACRYNAPGMVSALGLARAGGFVCARRDGFARLMIVDAELQFEAITDPEITIPGNRFNDGKVDPANGFWAGTMDNSEEQVRGSWWRLSPDGDIVQLAEGYKVTNGPAFDTFRQRVYLTDSALQTVRVATSDGTGLKAIETFLQFEDGEGYPDGMAVDREGCLWIAFWDGWAIRRFSPQGELLFKVEMPVSRPTSLVLAGDKVFVTSAQIGLSDTDLLQQPEAGSCFVVEFDRKIGSEELFLFG